MGGERERGRHAALSAVPAAARGTEEVTEAGSVSWRAQSLRLTREGVNLTGILKLGIAPRYSKSRRLSSTHSLAAGRSAGLRSQPGWLRRPGLLYRDMAVLNSMAATPLDFDTPLPTDLIYLGGSSLAKGTILDTPHRTLGNTRSRGLEITTQQGPLDSDPIETV